MQTEWPLQAVNLNWNLKLAKTLSVGAAIPSVCDGT